MTKIDNLDFPVIEELAGHFLCRLEMVASRGNIFVRIGQCIDVRFATRVEWNC